MKDVIFEVSERFRDAVERRIARLEQDALDDARIIPMLDCEDHRQRQMLLVATQIEEAVRLRARLSFDPNTALNFSLGCATVAAQ